MPGLDGDWDNLPNKNAKEVVKKARVEATAERALRKAAKDFVNAQGRSAICKDNIVIALAEAEAADNKLTVARNALREALDKFPAGTEWQQL